MKKILAVILFSVSLVTCYGQDKGHFGLGVGLDYGGFGTKFTFLPAPKLGLFAGLGYNLIGLGYNLGATFRTAPDNKVCPTLTAMYGYNAVIKLSGYETFEKAYSGPSIGAGLEFHGRNNPSNFFNVEILVPFRSKDYHDKMDELQADPNVEINELLPITISLGYHFGF